MFERLAAHDNLPQDHPLLQAGLLGGETVAATNTVQAMREFIQQIPSLRFLVAQGLSDVRQPSQPNRTEAQVGDYIVSWHNAVYWTLPALVWARAGHYRDTNG